MTAEDVSRWVNDWGPLITLASTVLLALITAWLAYLTKVMADSSRTATEHARTAAEASLASVAASEAAVEVEFAFKPETTSTMADIRFLLDRIQAEGKPLDDEPIAADLLQQIMVWHEVTITCLGATVSVHGCRLDAVGVVQTDAPVAPGGRFVEIESPGTDLGCDDELPKRCHRGESVTFLVEGRPTGEVLDHVDATVLYSLGTGPIRERSVTWRPQDDEAAREPR